MRLFRLKLHIVLPFIQSAHKKNDTIIQFRSPTVNISPNQHLRTSIHLDNWMKELKPFDYHPDPVFNNLTNRVITEASIIIVTVSATVLSVCGETERYWFVPFIWIQKCCK